MRYLIESSSTQEQLDTSGNHWTILHFFYDYRAGTETANQPQGMLRLFLLQLMQSVPSIASFLDKRDMRQRLMESTTQDFVDLLAAAIRSSGTRVCAFIDGLDEYDGDLWELCAQLETLRDRTGMKMCLASRPEPDLENAFRDFPTITMQDHNDASIDYYIQRRLLQYSSRRPTIQEAFSLVVQRALRAKAQGVTLWAKLVVDEMLEAYDQTTTEEALFALLEKFPPELGRLYDRLLEKVSGPFRSDSMVVLNLVANCYRGERELSETLLFETISFIYGTRTCTLFFGSQPIQKEIEFHVRSSLGRMLDFVLVDSRQPPDSSGRVIVKLIHETLATHLRRSDWHRSWLPTGAEHYHGPSAWAHLSLDVLTCVAKEEAFDVSALQFELGDNLKSQGVWLAQTSQWNTLDTSLAAISKRVRSQKWGNLSHLLRFCLLFVVDMLGINGAVAEARLEHMRLVLLSAAMSLHLSRCSSCRVVVLEYPFTRMRIQRLWKVGRLDLVFATIHGLTPYLEHELDAAQSQPTLFHDAFDLYIWHRPRHASDSHVFLEQCAKRGFYTNGRHLCTMQPPDWYEDVFHNLVESAQYTPADAWVRAHDNDCEYHGSSTTLIQHWCQVPSSCGFDSLNELLRVLALAGEDVNVRCGLQGHPMEMIFKIKVASSTDIWASEVICAKFLCLIEHGAIPPLAGRKENALSCAIRLRRKCSIYNHTIGVIRGKVDFVVSGDLDAMIEILKHFGKTGTWPTAELGHWKKRIEERYRWDARRLIGLSM